MAKRRREADSDGITAETEEYNTVFVDTSFDTHIAMLVSSFDTVSDFKKKLVLEHMQCFPKIGEIRIHSLKVKRRANSYHLPDIMLVWSAFHGVKGSWFLSVDASGAPACHLNQNSLELGTSNGVKLDVRNVNDGCRSLSSDVNRIQTLPTSLADGATENNVVSEMIDGYEVEKSFENTGFQSNNYSLVNSMGTESRPKKKSKMRHTKDVCHDPSPDQSNDMFPASGKDTSMTEIVVGGNSMINSVKEGPEGMILYEQQGKPIMSEAAAEVGVRNDQSNIEDRVAPEDIAPATVENSNLGRILDSQNLLGSDKRKEDAVSESIVSENLMASKLESEHGQDVPSEQSGGVSVKITDVPATSINASGATGDVNSGINNRKKKKSKKTDAKVQDTTDVKQTRKSESSKEGTHELERKEEEKDLSLNHDHEIMPSKSKASVRADPKEASFSPDLLDKNTMEPDVSSGNKKKRRRGMKSANTNLEKSGTEQTESGISGSSGLLCPSSNHILEETDKGERISCHKGKDVQMKSLDDSTKDASEKAQGANTNERDFVILTQTEQTLEDVITEEKKNQSSAGNRDAAIGKENPIVEVNQVEKDSENTETRDKKAEMKIKDVRMKLLNGSTKYVSEMYQGANTDDTNLAISTQTKQNFEDGMTEEKKREKKNQNSADNCHAAIGKENQMEFNQVEKDSKNTGVKEKKAKKKIKRRKVMASDVQENLPIKDQKVGNEVLTTEANSISLVNSKEEGKHVATSQVLSHKSEEKPEEMHGSAVNTDDLARTSENGGEGINFKQYFVHGQYQDQVDSSDEVKKATKSNEEMKSQKKVKENGLPSLSISTKLQNSLKSFENHEGENKSCVRKKSGKKQGESAQNSDREEVIPNSSRRSLKVSENGVKDSSPGEMRETTLQKFNEILAPSSHPNKKKPSLDISSLERSVMVPKKSGNKSLQSGLNVTNKMAKTPKKNGLLSKTGALFQDSSSGGSEDENENVCLNVRTHSPTDSSSLSDYSGGESDLSQDSPRNVSNDVKERSTGGKSMSKLDLSASKDMTMDMILRSSKRFKKAKLLVDSQNDEQNESQQVEFVPESQPI